LQIRHAKEKLLWLATRGRRRVQARAAQEPARPVVAGAQGDHPLICLATNRKARGIKFKISPSQRTTYVLLQIAFALGSSSGMSTPIRRTRSP
jgi:hypothetical protein